MGNERRIEREIKTKDRVDRRKKVWSTRDGISDGRMKGVKKKEEVVK